VNPEPDEPLGYGDVADDYRAAGWTPLPLPTGKKDPPPNGWTGADAPEPSRADIEDWKQGHSGGNVGLRMPDGVIGIDIDAYDGKMGHESFRLLVGQLGPLPRTWRSTSRTGPSGIGFFRVPEGKRWKGAIGRDIEIIQRRHRYAVAWPSVHPSGRTYQWYQPGGTEPSSRLPDVSELPMLPNAWVTALDHASGDIALFPEDHARLAAKDWHPEVRAAYWEGEAICSGAGGSRHDEMSKVVMRLLNHQWRKYAGAADAIAALRERYVAAIAPARPGGRGAAEDEWERMVGGGKDKVANDPPPEHVDLESLIAPSEQVAEAPKELPKILDLHDYVHRELPEFDWLVPNLFERQDRLILTAGEGHGKTTLLRQIGVQMAAGIHPFTLEDIPPVRVLHLDLENGDRFSQRKFRELYDRVAGRLDRRMHHPVIHSSGIDLGDPRDAQWLVRILEEVEPDIVIGGPIYKLWNGELNEEAPAKHALVNVLDVLRRECGIAIILEAHTPQQAQGHKRPTRPVGPSVQLRWPEFGVFLGKEGALEHWRGARDERDWPSKLMRGQQWPWMVEHWKPADADNTFADLMKVCREAGRILTQREIADVLGRSTATVNRSIQANLIEWMAFKQTLGHVDPDDLT
jgi:hypothetical protein